MEEKSAMALTNYVPHVSQEAAHIAGLRAHHLMSWPDDSSQEEEEDEHEEAEEQGEAGPESPSGSAALEQGETEQEAKPRRRRSREWGSIMDEESEEECLAFDDPQLDSDTTAGGHSPVRLTPWEPGLLRETAVEVHAWELEVEEL